VPRPLAFTAALLVAGCTTVADYQPYIPPSTVKDPVALAADKSDCMVLAQAYKPGIDLGRVAEAGAEGVGSNAASGLISPYAPIVGGAGQAGAAALNQLGILSQDQIRVFLRCLSNRSLRSGAYEMLDPAL
jgi:hypothetical protein